MELKWLEDFACLAQTRSFSRAAEERHVTQSAFSRRIRALEAWLEVALVDRATQPLALTDAGRRFLETAEETIRTLYASRQELQARARPAASGIVTIAALHTLSLRFFPHWFRAIEALTGPLQSRLLPDGLTTCLKALTEDDYDFMLMLHHPAVPILLEPSDYPHRVVGADAFVAVRSAGSTDATPALLGYPDDLLLGRMMTYAQGLDGSPLVKATHTNDSAIALKFMVLEGHGFAWLPHSLVADEIAAGVLVCIAPEIPMEVRLYRNARRRRSIVESVWAAAANGSVASP